jgi:hypothetical protein
MANGNVDQPELPVLPTIRRSTNIRPRPLFEYEEENENDGSQDQLVGEDNVGEYGSPIDPYYYMMESWTRILRILSSFFVIDVGGDRSRRDTNESIGERM